MGTALNVLTGRGVVPYTFVPIWIEDISHLENVCKNIWCSQFHVVTHFYISVVSLFSYTLHVDQLLFSSLTTPLTFPPSAGVFSTQKSWFVSMAIAKVAGLTPGGGVVRPAGPAGLGWGCWLGGGCWKGCGGIPPMCGGKKGGIPGGGMPGGGIIPPPMGGCGLMKKE